MDKNEFRKFKEALERLFKIHTRQRTWLADQDSILPRICEENQQPFGALQGQ